MERGLFISLEGPDGSGKSTQLSKLMKFFEERGMDCVYTREPGGTAIGEKIRDVILDKRNTEMAAMTEALLYAASRAQHVEELIKPALAAGKNVICDRFVDSSIAYQGGGRGLGESVRHINSYAVAGCMPDLTILMKLEPAAGRRRIKESDADRLEREDLSFHERVYEAYLRLERESGGRIVGVDASKDADEITAEIYKELEKLLSRRERGEKFPQEAGFEKQE